MRRSLFVLHLMGLSNCTGFARSLNGDLDGGDGDGDDEDVVAGEIRGGEEGGEGEGGGRGGGSGDGDDVGFGLFENVSLLNLFQRAKWKKMLLLAASCSLSTHPSDWSCRERN